MNRRMDIAGQSFIVTGAAKGIGLAISTLFHSLGARVSGWDLDDSGMKDNPVFADSRIVDVTDPSQTEAGFAASLAALGDIDGIVANAGVNGPTKPLWDYSLAEWQTVMSVDLTGVFLTVQPALDHLRARQRGRIIIISSIAGKEGNPGAVPYGAAKAGVIGLAKGLARELLPSEITVNCIAPSMAMTDLLDGMNTLPTRRAEFQWAGCARQRRLPMWRRSSPPRPAASPPARSLMSPVGVPHGSRAAPASTGRPMCASSVTFRTM